ncbi:hypothetical protein FACS18949_05550 [Clostridia bacterium]|nr:hypothetical protein FACS18949_05550 [Clostridia bacterium]
MDTNFRFVICTECGSQNKLDVTKKTSFCPSCGNRIEVAEAANKFAELFPERARDEAEQQNGEQPSEQPPEQPSIFEPADGSEPPPQPGLDTEPPLGGGAFDGDEEALLRDTYARAKSFLDIKDYAKAAELYTRIIEQYGDDEFAAHWGLFMVDERNFNVEEKLLQCFSCFAFRQGTAEIKKEILTNAHLEKALDYASADLRVQYSQAAQKHAETIVSLHNEGCNNLIDVFQRKYDRLEGTFQATGIMASSSRIGFPSGVTVKSMGENKLYLHFSVNRLNMLHLDVINVVTQPKITETMWHYRGIQMNPENGAFAWQEFRSFKNMEGDPEQILGELDTYHKIPYVLLGIWNDKFMVRSANKVYFCKACGMPDKEQQLRDICYAMNCIPVFDVAGVDDPKHKSSDFYYVQSISALWDTNQKSKWMRKSTGKCYVATAVYGDYDAPEVRVLRGFRDNTLKRGVFGRLFIRVYYALSPPLAKKLRPDTRAGRAIRRLLDKFVGYLKEKA